MAGAAGVHAACTGVGDLGGAEREQLAGEEQGQAPGLRLRDPLPPATRLAQHPRTGRQLGEAVVLVDVAPPGQIYAKEHQVVSRRCRCHPVGPDSPQRASPVRPRECDGLAQLLKRHPPSVVGMRPGERGYQALAGNVFQLLAGEVLGLHRPEASSGHPPRWALRPTPPGALSTRTAPL